MKRWRTALAGLLGMLFIGFALVWFLPARWAMPLLAGQLNGMHLKDVSGLLWDGHAGQVLSARGEALGQLDWQLSRRALLGDHQLRIDLQGPRIQFHGHMEGRGADEATWTDVQMRADLSLLDTRFTLPGGQPQGIIQVTANRLELRGGWPVTLDARMQWQDASLRTPRHDELPLGELQLTLRGSNGVIEGHLVDSGQGPLRIDGQLQLSSLAWRFNAVAALRHSVPALQRWLSGFGAIDADGITHIHYSGGLAAAMSGGKS